MGVEQLRIGDIVTVRFPEHLPAGHEQEGYRPALVLTDFSVMGPTRYPMILVAPLTTATGPWVGQNPGLYPVIEAGKAGLRHDSVVLLDNIRGIDERRVFNRKGVLPAELCLPILQVLGRVFAAKR